MSAAAATSPAAGCGARTRRALTKSTTPSLLRSWKTTPGRKKSDNAARDGALWERPSAPESATMTAMMNRRFMLILASSGSTRPTRPTRPTGPTRPSELVANRKLRLSRRRVDVLHDAIHRAEKRPAGHGVVAERDAALRDI